MPANHYTYLVTVYANNADEADDFLHHRTCEIDDPEAGPTADAPKPWASPKRTLIASNRPLPQAPLSHTPNGKPLAEVLPEPEEAFVIHKDALIWQSENGEDIRFFHEDGDWRGRVIRELPGNELLVVTT